MSTSNLRRHFIILVQMAFLAIFSGQALSDNVSLHYTDAGTAKDSGPADGVFETLIDPPGSVLNNGYQEDRTAIELDISSIPGGSTIESASLTFIHNLSDTSRQLHIYGYQGDGSVTLDDFTIGELVASNDVISPFQVDVTTFVQNLVDAEATYAGFSIREADDTDRKSVV